MEQEEQGKEGEETGERETEEEEEGSATQAAVGVVEVVRWERVVATAVPGVGKQHRRCGWGFFPSHTFLVG